MDTIYTLIIIVLALIASAFFSGMEIAYLSSNKLKLALDQKQSRLFGYISSLFTYRKNEYMTTILIGNNIALVVYSLKMSLLIGNVTQGYMNQSVSVLFETIISTIIIIFLAEFLPKSIVKNNPNFYYKTLYIPVYLFFILFYPISKLTTWLSNGIMWLVGMNPRQTQTEIEFNKGDLAHLVSDTNQDGEQLPEDNKEIKIFQNALDFSDLQVRNCMLRRVEIEAVDIKASVAEAKALFSQTKFSRLPVYKNSIDHIIGYINLKDLLKRPSKIEDMLHDIVFVPETMSAQKLLTQFIKNKNSLAIVLDEFGGTAGIITIEDILEEIFGEIEDEHDTNDRIERKQKDGSYILSARLEIDYLNEKYGFNIEESTEYDTLAGYIIYKNEGFPKPGEELTIDDLTLKILRMSTSKIELVKVTRSMKKDK